MALVGRELLQAPQAAICGRFRQRRPAAAAEVGDRCRGMPEAQRGELAQVVRKRIEVEPAQRFELRVRGSARTHEICVVGVRKPVGVTADRGDPFVDLFNSNDVLLSSWPLSGQNSNADDRCDRAIRSL